MLRNYFTTAIQNLWRSKGSTLINPKLRISVICSSSRRKRSFVWVNPDKKSFAKGFFRQLRNGNFPLRNPVNLSGLTLGVSTSVAKS